MEQPMRGPVVLLWGIMFALLTLGCAHTNNHNGMGIGGAEVFLPKVTSVTISPLAPILTSGGGFESEFTLALGDDLGPTKQVSGQLLVLGGKLRLEIAEFNGKAIRSGDFAVIWDAVADRGYVFSEALQGYAPINGMASSTNLFTQVIPGESEAIDGHPVNKANVTVMQSDGKTMTVQLSRAQDLGNLPLRIDSLMDRQNAFALALSKIQMVLPAEELFSPPDGFTKYENETVMLDELAERSQSLSGKGRERAGEGDNSAQPGGPPPVR
ncbi:MAG: hypothetical protein ABSE48_15765 [Verrucomicrobiota bacterium]